MSSQNELAQRLLHLARLKLEKETSAGQPKLFRLLVCANMADNASQLAKDHETRQGPNERKRRRGGHCVSFGKGATARALSPAAFMEAGDICVRRTGLEHVKSMQTLSRPQASLCDRTAFRRSLVRRDEQLGDHSLNFDSNSRTSDPTFSDGDDDNDNDEGYSDYSSKDDDRDLQAWHDYVTPTPKLSSTGSSHRMEAERSRPISRMTAAGSGKPHDSV